jgi:hypothetical protein
MRHRQWRAGDLGAGEGVEEFVGWVERSETHRRHQSKAMGIASLNPSYGLATTPNGRIAISPKREFPQALQD